MAIAWTNHNHGRGPGFRSRRTLRLIRSRKGPTPARARSYELTSEDLAQAEYGAFRAQVPIAPIAPWYVRIWRAFLTVLGYGPFAR